MIDQVMERVARANALVEEQERALEHGSMIARATASSVPTPN